VILEIDGRGLADSAQLIASRLRSTHLALAPRLLISSL
jgi:hypothetical protein